jgi:hypothetical protein
VAFANAADAGTMELYLNGVLQTNVTRSSSGYTGMSNTAQAVDIGRYFGSVEAKGSIRDVKIFNRELTASEIAELARGNDLGFSEEWGGAYGGVYTQDATPSGEWAAIAGSVSDEAGPIVGKSNVLGYTVDTALASHYARLPSVFTAGKRYRVSFDYLVDAANDVVTSLRIYDGSFYAGAFTPTAGTWNRVTVELEPSIVNLRIYASQGTTTSIQDPAGDDKFYIDGLTITEVGTLADFRAERYDTSTNKLYDISDNAFVGTGTSVSLTGREQPVYETGTWTPSITFGGGSTGITYSAQEGYYTRIGDVVHIEGNLTLTAVGSDTGTAKLEGFPFTSRNTTDSAACINFSRAQNMASLTSQINGFLTNNTTAATLYDWGAAGSTGLTEANFTATTQLRFSGTYKIQ